MKYTKEDIDTFIDRHRGRLNKLIQYARELDEVEGDGSLEDCDDYTLMTICIETLDLIKEEAS